MVRPQVWDLEIGGSSPPVSTGARVPGSVHVTAADGRGSMAGHHDRSLIEIQNQVIRHPCVSNFDLAPQRNLQVEKDDECGQLAANRITWITGFMLLYARTRLFRESDCASSASNNDLQAKERSFPAVSTLQQSKITHVEFILDGSGSMFEHRNALIKAFDNQVAFLAQLSKDTDQETRVTVYVFDDCVECVIFDKDVLRLPSIRDLYWVRGRTALRDAVVRGQQELDQTCQLYGDHSFLTFVLTDGMDNASSSSILKFREFLSLQRDNKTIGVLVPDVNAKIAAQEAGFPDGNISIWRTESATGVEEAFTEVQAATQDYYAMRAAGGVGTRALFSTDASAVNAATIKAAKLQPLAKGTYDLITVARIKTGEGTMNKDKKSCWEIKAFLEHNGLKFVLGRNFYKMAKQELIAGDKELAVREKSTNNVYVGVGVRDMIGLSGQVQRVAPDKNPDYDIFVQSKSNNRYLFQGDEILVLKDARI